MNHLLQSTSRTAKRHFVAQQACRKASTSSSHQAVVIGSGPAGVTAMGNLLDQGIEDVLMVDPHFNGGRLNERYRNVPSNTKVKTFIDWATGTDTFRSIIERSASHPNAVDAMQRLDVEKECQLAYASDAVLMHQEALRRDSRVSSTQSYVHSLDAQSPVAEGHGPAWTLNLSGNHSITSPLVVLATGASPKSLPTPHSLKPLELDDILDQSKLDNLSLDPATSRVAVVGSSHSAVLALKFLYDRGVPVTNFYRDDLKYAVYKDGWILYDNTGLKGDASRWAKEVLANIQDPILQRVCLRQEGKSESQIYADHLTSCTHMVHAIGFTPHTLPINGQQSTQYDPLKGNMLGHKGLYGCGIAFPEQVTDPAGNVEFAVGLFKFMKGAKKMVPNWIEESRALQWR